MQFGDRFRFFNSITKYYYCKKCNNSFVVSITSDCLKMGENGENKKEVRVWCDGW